MTDTRASTRRRLARSVVRPAARARGPAPPSRDNWRVPGRERLSIAHVTPHPWGPYHEVNEFVASVTAELQESGHRVLIAAPSDSRGAIRDSRRIIRAALKKPESIFDGVGGGGGGRDGSAPVLAVGQGIPMPRGPRPRAAPVPLDVSRTLEQLLGSVPLDIVHVHDPFAPSVSSTALRHSHSLNVGTFHEPTERVLSTQVARPLVEIFFGRLDARTVSNRETGELVERYFPGTYDLVAPGADAVDPPASARDDGPVRVAFCLREERGAFRLFLRALRRLRVDAAWEAVVWAERPLDPMTSLHARVRGRVGLGGPG